MEQVKQNVVTNGIKTKKKNDFGKFSDHKRTDYIILVKYIFSSYLKIRVRLKFTTNKGQISFVKFFC